MYDKNFLDSIILFRKFHDFLALNLFCEQQQRKNGQKIFSREAYKISKVKFYNITTKNEKRKTKKKLRRPNMQGDGFIADKNLF
jgi:hypothetical protein